METSGAGGNVDEIGSGVANGEVPEPVGCNGKGHGLGTDVEREDLTNNDPGDGAPGGGEGSNVDAHECDERLLAGGVVNGDGDADDCDEVLANTHNDGTPDEERATTKSLDTPHTGESHEDVYDVGSDGSEEGVGDTRVGEECSTVVEDEVDTSELLPCLDEDTGEGTESDLIVAGPEAIEVRRLAVTLLLLEVGTNVLQLEFNLGVVGSKRGETAQGLDSVSIAALLNQETRRLRKPDHADGEDECPYELDTSGDTPRRVIVTVLGSIVDDRGKQKTNGNGPLVT